MSPQSWQQFWQQPGRTTVDSGNRRRTQEVAPRERFELPTYCLEGSCSSTELAGRGPATVPSRAGSQRIRGPRRQARLGCPLPEM